MSKNFELLQRTNSEQGLFQTPDALPRLVSAAGSKLRLAQGKVFEKRVLKSSGLRWLNLIKEGARSWERQLQERNNDRPSDLEALAREEAIKLVQSVFLAVDHGAPQAVLFAGVEGEAGCASICARAAEILAAQSDGPVCVVDANFRSPSLHGYFGIDNSKGLAEAVLNSGPIQEFAQRLAEPNLWVMPSGLVAARLSFPQVSGPLQSRMTELRTAFRHVVIHSSPFNGGTDSILLSRWTDGVVLVVEADSTRRETARRVKETLEVANVRVLGVVMNNRTFPIPEAVYRRL